MPSLPFLDRPSRTVAVTLDDIALDAIDLLRTVDPDAPSRSAVLRELIHFALALTLDADARAEFIAACADVEPAADRPLDLHPRF